MNLAGRKENSFPTQFFRVFRVLYCILLLIVSVSAKGQVREIESPAPPGSVAPNLAVGQNGRVYLSWIEKLGDNRAALRFSVREGDGWTAARTIAEGANWFVNWADFPSIVALPDGSLAAHWLVKSGPATFAYDVHISRSFDGGKTWGKSFVPHRDGTQTEHGFVSMFPAGDGLLAAVWLDGREMKSGGGDHGHGEMTLRYASIAKDGKIRDEAALDARVCECCQTSAAMTEDGPVVVYRDRSEDEIRDISIQRRVNGRWSGPQTVVRDGWKINGCPVNGPAVAAAGRRVAVAWYTGADDAPQVKFAASEDGGASFAKPLRIDGGHPVGRVGLVMTGDGAAWISWLEKTGSGGEVRVRRIDRKGNAGDSITVAPSGTARSNGFPRMVVANDRLIFAWTGGRVLTAELQLR